MIVDVSTTDELTVALDAATGGETILLAPGDYDRFIYFGSDQDWSAGGVTIRSADPGNPAVFIDKVDIRDVNNLTISDITFDAASLAESATDSWVSISRSSEITLENIVQRGHLATAEEGFDPYDPAIANFRDPIEGFPRAIGLRVSQTDGFTLRDSDLAEVRVAISLTKVSDVVIENTQIHAVREGINFTDVDGLEIAGNTFRDFTPWLDLADPAYNSTTHEHPDMIQYWAANATEGVRNVTIADNIFEMPQGSSTQTILGHMRNPAPGVTAENFAILNNLILNGHPNALWIGDVEGGLIAGNVILPNGTDVEKAWTARLQLTGTSENFHVVNNAAVDWFTAETLGPRDAGGLAAQNITVENFRILGYGPNDDDYWGDISVEALRAALYTDPSTLGITVSGSAGNDLLLGLGGGDTILLGPGSDTAIGGYGADRFVLDFAARSTSDAHQITDLDFAEGDRLEITGFHGRNVDIDSAAALQSFITDSNVLFAGETLTLLGSDNRNVTLTLPGVTPADGGTGDDPDQSDDDLPASTSLIGSGADDILAGTPEDDAILLRQGADIATGGAGADQFILDGRFHWDGDSHIITDLDFAQGDTLVVRSLASNQITVGDQAGLDALVARSDVSAVQQTDALILSITDPDGPEITLQLDGLTSQAAISAAPLKFAGSNDDDLLSGAAGADNILFRFGNDTTTGGDGADRFILDARYVWDGDTHAITDFDFAEGDSLILRFFDSGTVTADSAAALDALKTRPEIDILVADGLTLLTVTDPEGDVLTLSL